MTKLVKTAIVQPGVRHVKIDNNAVYGACQCVQIQRVKQCISCNYYYHHLKSSKTSDAILTSTSVQAVYCWSWVTLTTIITADTATQNSKLLLVASPPTHSLHDWYV
jgi:hypothetical protein